MSTREKIGLCVFIIGALGAFANSDSSSITILFQLLNMFCGGAVFLMEHKGKGGK